MVLLQTPCAFTCGFRFGRVRTWIQMFLFLWMQFWILDWIDESSDWSERNCSDLISGNLSLNCCTRILPMQLPNVQASHYEIREHVWPESERSEKNPGGGEDFVPHGGNTSKPKKLSKGCLSLPQEWPIIAPFWGSRAACHCLVEKRNRAKEQKNFAGCTYNCECQFCVSESDSGRHWKLFSSSWHSRW